MYRIAGNFQGRKRPRNLEAWHTHRENPQIREVFSPERFPLYGIMHCLPCVHCMYTVYTYYVYSLIIGYLALNLTF